MLTDACLCAFAHDVAFCFATNTWHFFYRTSVMQVTVCYYLQLHTVADTLTLLLQLKASISIAAFHVTSDQCDNMMLCML